MVPALEGVADFNDLPSPVKIKIILDTLDETNGFLPVKLTRNKNLLKKISKK
jgi:hypothetical protein